MDERVYWVREAWRCTLAMFVCVRRELKWKSKANQPALSVHSAAYGDGMRSWLALLFVSLIADIVCSSPIYVSDSLLSKRWSSSVTCIVPVICYRELRFASGNAHSFDELHHNQSKFA
ncbi:hypothetical protein Tcan_18036 [Toxocara canis]|uniref:Uncharacterized protein n=1 Tax=Toxocara canis TaxID=6265 RepID=A0A0B2VKD5_TOXCA|nr:hypothetical protein Tcan_18036 [Toxocara canis]